MSIPVIDLFAGPGGLGEGFSSLRDQNGNPVFKIHLSIEKDHFAHKTLELRSFFRQFPDGKVPEDYYRYIRREGITKEELFSRNEREAKAAQKEAWRFELAKEHALEIDERIKEALDGEQLWVLIGGPPCQAYSIVGRSRMRGSDPSKYENDPRHYLYKEYLRTLTTHRPPVFVMENVKGILSSRVNGEAIFEKILHDLSLAGHNDSQKGYRLYTLNPYAQKAQPGDFVIHAEKHNIPQRRHRVIVVGVRSDLDVKPEPLYERQTTVTVGDAILDLPRIRSGISKELDSFAVWSGILEEFSKNTGRLEPMPEDVRKEIEMGCISRDHLTLGGEFIPIELGGHPSVWLKEYAWWFMDERLKGYSNHSARSHIRQDLFRYLYASCYAKARKTFPRIADFPYYLRPAHHNVEDAAAGKLFTDRFRVQLEDKPSTTVVSHISKDGHYFIHPDTTQCRSLTVREAARLQTFPDNYFFEGNRTSQYTQVGNAVPPLLARQIGQSMAELLGMLYNST
ncbi:MAG: DNA cytosine methyltransferase [Proteobacteria bacterium]|nr:DNA cytosine methyltransferase [Pseudomonadota bacterium]